MREMAKLFGAGMMGAITAVACCLFLMKPSAFRQVGKVDVRILLKEEARQISERHLSPKEEEQTLKEEMHRLHKVLAQAPSSLLLLDSQAIVSSQVPDYTPWVRQKLAAEKKP